MSQQDKSVILFADKYLHCSHDGDFSQEFPSYEEAMTWIRKENTGSTGVYTYENVRIYGKQKQAANAA